jgi:hypothetical protein
VDTKCRRAGLRRNEIAASPTTAYREKKTRKMVQFGCSLLSLCALFLLRFCRGVVVVAGLRGGLLYPPLSLSPFAAAGAWAPTPRVTNRLTAARFQFSHPDASPQEKRACCRCTAHRAGAAACPCRTHHHQTTSRLTAHRTPVLSPRGAEQRWFQTSQDEGSADNDSTFSANRPAPSRCEWTAPHVRQGQRQ